MAIFNEILSARFARMAQKLFSMKGSPPIRALGGELQAVLPFFNGVENRYLEGFERFAVLPQAAAVAAQNSACQLRNPSSSGVVAVIEKIYASVTVADGLVKLGNQVAADLGAVDINHQLDLRTRKTGAVISSHGNNIASPASLIGFLALAANIGADFLVTENQEITLLPGDGVIVESNNVNLTLTVFFMWRERPLEDSEKA